MDLDIISPWMKANPIKPDESTDGHNIRHIDECPGCGAEKLERKVELLNDKSSSK